MEAYKKEFIEFMVDCNVLRFGDFVTKSGRKTPFFVNTGFYRTGAQLRRLGAYYAEAVDWAAETGVTLGVSKTHFAPNAAVTRGQAVTLLWRLAGEPETETQSAFSDVPAERYDAGAVAWAAEQGVTKGVSSTRFAPDDACTRAQIVTFLCRADDAIKTEQEA